MSPLALGLLLLAALLHAGWNVLAKQAVDRPATLYAALLLGGLLLAPALALSWPPPPEAVGLALAASVFEALYFVTLTAAYAVGDFSLVYPVSRASAPLLIAAWAVLFLAERPSPAGWAGIGAVVAGLLLISAPTGKVVAGGSAHRSMLALGLALATGLCISGYSTLNKVGLAYLWAPAFTALFHLGTAALLAPLMLRAHGRGLLAPWRRQPIRTVAIGVMLSATSVLVLAALAVERAAYVGAVREVSVVFGALAGWLLLGEPLGQRRTLAAAIMFAGLALIATRG